MRVRPRAALAVAGALVLSACAPEAPDYQSIWSTTSTTTTAAAPPDEDQEQRLSIAAWLERQGVVGQQVAPNRITDLTVTMPTPPGWQPYQNPNLSPGTRMIAKGSTYPTAMTLAWSIAAKGSRRGMAVVVGNHGGASHFEIIGRGHLVTPGRYSLVARTTTMEFGDLDG